MGGSASVIKEFNEDEKLYLKYSKIVDKSLWLFLVLKKIKIGCVIAYNLDYLDDITGFEKILSNRNLNWIRVENANDKKKLIGLQYLISYNQIDNSTLETHDQEKYHAYMNYLLGGNLYLHDYDSKKDVTISFYHLIDKSKEKIFGIQLKKKNFSVVAINSAEEERNALEYKIKQLMPNLFSKFEVKIDFCSK